jgi:hypothetical protein
LKNHQETTAIGVSNEISEEEVSDLSVSGHDKDLGSSLDSQGKIIFRMTRGNFKHRVELLADYVLLSC